MRSDRNWREIVRIGKAVSYTHLLDEESEHLDDSEDNYQQAFETYEQAKEELDMANQRVSEIKEAIAGKQRCV